MSPPPCSLPCPGSIRSRCRPPPAPGVPLAETSSPKEMLWPYLPLPTPAVSSVLAYLTAAALCAIYPPNKSSRTSPQPAAPRRAAFLARCWPELGVQGQRDGDRNELLGGGDGSVVTSPSRTPLKDSQGEEEEVVWGGSWLHAPLALLFSELAAPCLAPPCTAPSPKGHRDPRKGRMGTGRCTQAGARGQLQGAWGETSCMGSRRRRGLGRCRRCWERLRRHPAGLPLEAKERHELFMISFNQING